jgi:hypothetical protein
LVLAAILFSPSLEGGGRGRGELCFTSSSFWAEGQFDFIFWFFRGDNQKRVFE